MRALFYDTETGDLDPEKGSLLAVGALVIDIASGEIFDKMEMLHKLPSKDDYKVTPKALEKNKLSIDICFNEGVPADEIAARLMDMYLENSCLLAGGHNSVHFDDPWLAIHLYGLKSGIQLFQQVFTNAHPIDTQHYMRLIQGLENTKVGSGSLKKMVNVLGVDTSKAKKLLHCRGSYHESPLFDAWCASECAKIIYQNMNMWIPNKGI